MANSSPTLITGCSVCHTKQHLSVCTGCKVVKYCGAPHQKEDRPAHKSICKTISKKAAILVQERHETTLFNAYGGGLSAMLGNGALIDPLLQFAMAQLQIHTHMAVESALALLLEMVDIVKNPHTGPADLVPACFLRLGRDQEAYDFMKWWVESPAPRSAFGPSPQLYSSHAKKANVFEDVEFFKGNCPCLTFMISLTLLKLRLLVDLQALQRSTKMGESVPTEILDKIRSHLTSTAISGNKQVLERDDHEVEIRNLTKQVRTMYAAVQEGNSRFWPALLHTKQELWGTLGDEEIEYALKSSYRAWAETPGAIAAIEELEGGKA